MVSPEIAYVAVSNSLTHSDVAMIQLREQQKMEKKKSLRSPVIRRNSIWRSRRCRHQGKVGRQESA